MRISRVESAGGAISGVCFAPRSRDQLRTSLRRRVANGQGRGTLYCCRFTRHAYLTPARSSSLSLSNPVSLSPSASALYLSVSPANTVSLANLPIPRARLPSAYNPPSVYQPAYHLPIYRALISVLRITPRGNVCSHSRDH